MREIIGNSEDKVYVIAEIGQNHQGCLEIAKKMILEAKNAGCDCVKFQKSCLIAKFTKSALSRRYDGAHSWGSTYGEHKEYLEFDCRQYRELQAYCNQIQIDFTASAMDEISLDFLVALNVPFIKIGSGDANNCVLLKKVAKLAIPVVVSTGMQTMKTIERIVEIMTSENKRNYALLHCVSAYPTAPENCNLQMISLMKKTFPHVIIGYSGHELGIEITKAAVLAGAKIVERHFTLDKNQKGSDHKCSLEPSELVQLVRDIEALKKSGLLAKAPIEPHEILSVLGDNEPLRLALKEVTEKTIQTCERSCKQKLGKSIVAAKELKCDQKLQSEDICIKVSEPNGIPAEEYESVKGAVLACDISEDNPIMYIHIVH